jgi:hypothetical protein
MWVDDVGDDQNVVSGLMSSFSARVFGDMT